MLERKIYLIDLEKGVIPVWGFIYYFIKKELQIFKQYIADAIA